MPANIANSVNGSAFISLREMPWHRQGVVVEEEMSGREFIKAGGVDYPVATFPLSGPVKVGASFGPIGWNEKADAPIIGLKGGEEEVRAHPLRGVYRADTGDVFPGAVGPGFELYQQHEIIDFFEELVQGRKIRYEVAGALGAGELVWVLAHIPDLSMAIRGDDFRNYLLITNGHCGNSALQVWPTSVRVVCSNTMAMSRAERRNDGRWGSVRSGYTIRHTRNMRMAVSQVAKAYHEVLDDFQTQKEMYEFLAGVQVSEATKEAFFNWVAAGNKVSEVETLRLRQQAADDTLTAGDKSRVTRFDSTVDTLERLYESETNQQAGTRNTMFSLLQTAVEYYDHERPVRCTGDECNAKRFETNMFSSAGLKLKNDAVAKILDLAQA